jgi:DNA polymerase
MTPIEYIMDHARFEIIGCAVKEGDDKPFWLEEKELRGYLRGLPKKTAVVSHNSLFDMCICSWRLDYVPHLMIDTLGMARAMLSHRLRSLSLNSVATHLGLGVKGDTVHKVIGMNLAAIKAAGFYDQYADYSCNDAELCWQIYRKLIDAGFPASEIAVMDTVLRCAVQPKFVLDATLLAEHHQAVLAGKQGLLDRVNMTSRDDLLSNDRFAGALRMLGVEPPTKVSLVTGKETFAFAKTDPAFIALEEHENPEVQALVAARLGIKSTLEETRTERFMRIAQITWPSYQQTGLLPMALRYSGAHTHRLSGDWKLNVQNLPSRGNNKIRSAIKAPPGHTVLAVDSSQIEARVAAVFCGQTDMVQAFADKEDIYSSFASQVFNRPVSKKTNPVERYIGKTAILGLQYGLGWEKFQKTVALQSKAQVGKEVILTDIEAAGVVDTYRQKYRHIPAMWRTLNNLIPHMTGPNLRSELGPVTFTQERVLLPSGLALHYHKLHNKDGSWWFEFAGEPKYIYGGKMLENIVQALARICVMDAAVRIRRRLVTLTSDVWLNLQVHDELVYIVPDDMLDTVETIVMEEMCRRPAWGPDIPLDAEAGRGPSYGDAK